MVSGGEGFKDKTVPGGGAAAGSRAAGIGIDALGERRVDLATDGLVAVGLAPAAVGGEILHRRLGAAAGGGQVIAGGRARSGTTRGGGAINGGAGKIGVAFGRDFLLDILS